MAVNVKALLIKLALPLAAARPRAHHQHQVGRRQALPEHRHVQSYIRCRKARSSP